MTATPLVVRILNDLFQTVKANVSIARIDTLDCITSDDTTQQKIRRVRLSNTAWAIRSFFRRHGPSGNGKRFAGLAFTYLVAFLDQRSSHEPQFRGARKLQPDSGLQGWIWC
jgi:hypothetical protein